MNRDITELAKRLHKFYEFYYALIEAKQIHLNLNENEPMRDYIEVVRVDKSEWDRWQKIKSIINTFKIPE